jgi:hypothetical protein
LIPAWRLQFLKPRWLVNKLNWLYEATATDCRHSCRRNALVYGPVYCQRVIDVKIVRASPPTPYSTRS